jgi:Ca-activated chloride channel family protein
MRWGNPQWLYALLALPLLVVAVSFELKRRKQRLAQFARESVWSRIIPELDWRLPTRKAWVLLFSLVFLILALARPQWGEQVETVTVTGLDVIVALDVSNSMEVEDVVPSRLKKAKHLVRSIIERLNGDRVGIVAFAGSAYPASPLTTDLGYVLETLDILGPSMVANQGTDLGTALDVAARALDRGAEDTSEAQDSSRVIILVSDGEDHEEGAVEKAIAIRKTGTKLYIFGVGTSQGGPIPVRDERGQLRGYKRDSGGGSVVSTFNPDALKRLAKESGGKYWSATPSESEVDDLLQDMSRLDRSENTEKRRVSYIERFQIPLAVALLLLIVELALPARKIALILLMACGIGGVPSWAHAKTPSVGAFLQNEEALGEMERGELTDARSRLGDAQARSPDLGEIDYNLGHLNAAEKAPERAQEAFGTAAEKAQKQGDPALAGKAFFNRGVMSSATGKLEEAARDYASALELAQKAGDLRTAEAARKNLSLLVQQRQQQKQQGQQGEQSEQKGDQQGDSKDQSGEGKEDPNKKDGKGGQNENQEKKDQTGKQDKEVEDPSKSRKRYEFNSSKMTKEDAEKVMAELSSREKELQRRLKKQKGSVQSGGKDW